MCFVSVGHVWVWVHPPASSEATRAHRWTKEPISSAVSSCTRRFVIARPAAKCLYAACEHALGCVARFCGTRSSPAITGVEINNHFSASNFSNCVESPLSWNCRAPPTPPPPSHTQAHKARTHTCPSILCAPVEWLQRRDSLHPASCLLLRKALV